MEDYRVGMGRRMKEKRKLLHLTQEDMAEMLDISVKHYSGVERGVAGLSLENLVYLSDILGMDLDYLVKGETEKRQRIPRTLSDIYVRCPEDKKEYLIEIFAHMPIRVNQSEILNGSDILNQSEILNGSDILNQSDNQSGILNGSRLPGTQFRKGGDLFIPPKSL